MRTADDVENGQTEQDHEIEETMGHNPAHAAHTIHSAFHALPRLKKRKDPTAAAILGFFFGGFGLGLYFWTWADFFLPVIAFVLTESTLGTIIPGVGLIPGWLFASIFAAIWGAARASKSGGGHGH